MKFIHYFILSFFIVLSYHVSGQNLIKQVADITGSDTCCVETYIGEIHYFGKNAKKARLYPQYSCITGNVGCKILWVPSKRWNKRAKITVDQFNDYVYGIKENGFEDYPCFAFFRKYNVKKFPDGAIYEPVFPDVIEVYQYKNNNWEKLFDREVESDTELGLLQLELVR